MLAYTAGDTDVPLLEETIGDNFERIVARFPYHDALIEAAAVPGGEARRWSYTKLNDDVDRVGRALLARGVAKGARIGVWSPNCAEWTILQYATAKIGAVLVNVNPAYRSHELEFVVKQNGMRMLVCAPSDRNSDYTAMARQALAECPELRELVFLPDTGLAELTAGVPETEAERTFAELLKRADDVGHSALKARMAELDPYDAINLQ
jgi:fatty-acyl-CoA synthase